MTIRNALSKLPFTTRHEASSQDSHSDAGSPNTDARDQAGWPGGSPQWPSDTRTYASPRSPDRIGVCPPNYMQFFKEHEGRLDWYRWMYESRRHQHEAFQNWFRAMDQVEQIDSALEFGCGYGVGYAEFFAGRRYVGVDLVTEAVQWCTANSRDSRHEFLLGDFITQTFDETFDVVFSQGTIDNTYDIDGFLENSVRASKRWIYITAYRGYFPDLPDHVYRVVEDQGTFYNDISPRRVVEKLADLGVRNVTVFPSFTGGHVDAGGIPYETVIVARVGARNE